MKTTKKELELEVKRLTALIDDMREKNKGFNKYSFVAGLEGELKSLIEKGEIEDIEGIEEYINRDLDNAVIYYKDCFEICMELNATHFELEETGEMATDICQLAYYSLREYVLGEIDMRELEELIEAKQNEEA